MVLKRKCELWLACCIFAPFVYLFDFSCFLPAFPGWPDLGSPTFKLQLGGAAALLVCLLSMCPALPTLGLSVLVQP
jgi:hypothetical protein